MQSVPLQRAPAQDVQVELGVLSVRLSLRVHAGALYADVACNGVQVCVGALCLDRVPITPRAAQLGLSGLRLVFADLQGRDPPDWTQFGARFVLLNAPLDTTTENVQPSA